MIDQKIIDYGSLVLAGLITLIVQSAPQLKEIIVGPENDPARSILFGFLMLGLSQLGSYLAKKQISSTSQPENVESVPDEDIA